MDGPGREEIELSRLLRAAAAAADELETRLRDLRTAHSSAVTSLDWLAQAVRAEEEAQKFGAEGLAHFNGFLEGADKKRAALSATRDMLAAEIEDLRAAFAEATAERKKFERLLKNSRRAHSKASNPALSSLSDAHRKSAQR